MDSPAASAEHVQEALYPTYMAARDAILRKKNFIQKVKKLKYPCIVIGVTRKT